MRSSPTLVTGAHGFVGMHLLEELGDQAQPLDADVTDADALAQAVRAVSPAAVVHLAALSSVASSRDDEASVWAVNAIGSVNVLAAVASEAPEARVLIVSTGDVYGRADLLPTPEDAPARPLSPYAASKAAAEVAAGYARRARGLDILVARAFTHIGPAQSESFALGSWTRQIAELEHQEGGVLRVGDLTVRRDLTDVRDVCRAYRLLLERSVPANTYNVASGVAVPLADVVDVLVSLARCPVSVERDPSRGRPADIPVQQGDAGRLRAATGWRPEIPLERTVADALDYARAAMERQRTKAG